MRLLADAALLPGHHASQVPLVVAPASTGSAARSPAAVTAFAEQVASLSAEVKGMRTAARTDELSASDAMSAFAEEGADIDSMGLQLTTALAELATLCQRGLGSPADPRPPGGLEEEVFLKAQD